MGNKSQTQLKPRCEQRQLKHVSHLLLYYNWYYWKCICMHTWDGLECGCDCL